MLSGRKLLTSQRNLLPLSILKAAGSSKNLIPLSYVAWPRKQYSPYSQVWELKCHRQCYVVCSLFMGL
jgi:hypothetical protein